MIKKIIKNARSIKERSIMLKRLSDYYEIFFNSDTTLYPALLKEIPWNKILVLTPHADDETIGCGGFLIKAAKPGKSIRVVLYSDNQESINSNNKKSAIETRSAEFREAMNILGINDFHELKLAPSNFRLTEETVELTTGEINEYLPDVILLPSFIDNHEEHKILNLILSKALQRISYKTDILMYEVWSAIYPNTIFDITDVMEQKQKALKSYASQLENIDYVGAISGLNRYRSLTIKGNGYCEGFAYLNSGDYLKLIRKFG